MERKEGQRHHVQTYFLLAYAAYENKPPWAENLGCFGFKGVAGVDRLRGASNEQTINECLTKHPVQHTETGPPAQAPGL